MRSTVRDAMATFFLCGLLAGCTDVPADPGSGGSGSEDGSGSDMGGDPGGGPGGGNPGIDPIQGQYDSTTTYDLGSVPVVTDLLVLALSTLDGLAADPAGLLIQLLDDANVPILDQLLGLLGPLVLDRIRGLINDFVLARIVDGLTAADQLNDLLGSLTGLLSVLDVVSELDLAGLSPTGTTTADHTLSAVAFSWQGQTVVADTPALIDRVTGARGVPVDVSMDGASGAIGFADHTLGLPFSDLAVVGMNQFISQNFGAADLRGALGRLFDCPALAESVASSCGIGCLGLDNEIGQLCESGLDQAAAQVENRMRALDFASMEFRSGQAVLQRGPDGVVESIQGTWQTLIHVDGADVPLPAPFAAERRE